VRETRDGSAGSTPDYPVAAASARMVNRTHRVVRERARFMQERKSRTRSLWIPVGVSAGLIVLLIVAAWSVLDQTEAAPTGLPDASQQIFVLLLWCLPVTAALLVAVWVRRAGQNNQQNGENTP
jgi:protein-S-isoprenylcysteine O-methyltransferase Ste14